MIDDAALEIYSGRVLIGEVAQVRSGQFSATTADGKKLGLFNTAQAASRAIWEAARAEATP